MAAELALSQALQDMGGHGAPCLAASAQATLGDRRGGGTGPGGTAAPNPLLHSPVPIAGHLVGTSRAPQPGTAGGHSRVWLAPPCHQCPPVGWATPAQGHHDPPELVLCHLGSLGEIPSILPPALPCLPAH